MKAHYILPLTIIALGFLYLGCVNPQTLDPRVSAGNATTTTQTTSGTTGSITSTSTSNMTPQNATGYWIVDYLLVSNGATRSTGVPGRLAIRQNADGSLVGEFDTGNNGTIIKDGSNQDGEVTFSPENSDGFGTDPFSGTISADGTSMLLTETAPNPANNNYYQCTRLY